MEAIPRDYGEQCRFDAFCKTVLRNEARNYHRDMKRQRDRETSFGVLPQAELDKLYTVDHYPSDDFVFSSHGYDLHDLVSQLQPEIARGGKIGVYPVSELRIRLNLLLKARGDNDQRIDLLLIDQMIYHACRDITVIRVFLNIIPTVAALTKPVALIICAAVHQKQHVVFLDGSYP